MVDLQLRLSGVITARGQRGVSDELGAKQPFEQSLEDHGFSPALSRALAETEQLPLRN